MNKPHPYNHHQHQLRDEMISNICGYCIVLKVFHPSYLVPPTPNRISSLGKERTKRNVQCFRNNKALKHPLS